VSEVVKIVKDLKFECKKEKKITKREKGVKREEKRREEKRVRERERQERYNNKFDLSLCALVNFATVSCIVVSFVIRIYSLGCFHNE
jgi:hypothetical protein